MNLKIQIFSMIFSFLFGIFFSMAVKLNYRFLFLGRIRNKIMANFVFFIVMSLLYFFCLKKINEGILNYYFLLLFGLGWYFGNYVIAKISK